MYQLAFLESAKKEWDKLDTSLRVQFKKKLAECLIQPHIIKNKLSGLNHCYKIKLRAAGYRLVYRVFDDRLVVQVNIINKRDKALVYKKAAQRLNQLQLEKQDLL